MADKRNPSQQLGDIIRESPPQPGDEEKRRGGVPDRDTADDSSRRREGDAAISRGLGDTEDGADNNIGGGASPGQNTNKTQGGSRGGTT